MGAVGVCHGFAIFRSCETPGKVVSSSRKRHQLQGGRTACLPDERVLHLIMDDDVQKSCWGLTAKAVVGFAVFLLLAWLVSGGAEKAAVVAGG